MEIQPYGTMIAVGIVVSGAVGWWFSRRFSVDFNDIVLLFTYGIFFGFVGAKGAYLLLNIHQIPWSDKSLLQVVEDGGFIFYGGIPTGAVGVFLAKRIHRLDLEKALRICAPLLPLGHAFGRLGCCLAGCCYGVAYNGPFAITYHGSLIAPNEIALFPVQILESVLLVLISAALTAALFKGVGLRGLCLFYFSGYSVMRFCLEFLRGDLERGIAAGLSTSQWVSLVILILVGCYRLCHYKEKTI